jgi:hypothetical protein
VRTDGARLLRRRVVLEQPVGTFLWLNLFDAIHRRGQLSTYLQAMGGSMPPSYEPAATPEGLSRVHALCDTFRSGLVGTLRLIRLPDNMH